MRAPPDEHEGEVLDDALDDEDLRAEAEAQDHAPPSFAAIVARAHRIDPRAVGADAIERAAKFTRAPRMRAAVPPAATDDLAPMIAVLRAHAERDIGLREDLGVPECGLLLDLEARRRAASTRRWIAAVSAIAAAAIVVFGLDVLQSWSARRAKESPDSTQAVAAVRDEPVVHDAEEVEPIELQRAAVRPQPVRPRVEVDPIESLPPAPLEAAPAPAVLPEEAAPLESDAVVNPRAVARGAAAKVPADAALRRLDELAQAALARGDRSEADELYARIIARGRRHPLVEIAFAERFSLVRGRGTEVQRALWNAYLAKFPAGRFADDAQAGLCRVAAAADKAACWQGYVDRFPAGAYRRHADRWLSSGSTP